MKPHGLQPTNQTNSVPNVKHGMQTDRGTCHDCSQGAVTSDGPGFEYWNEDSDGRGFWFCRHCGSNHVTVICGADLAIEQGDLYDQDGLPNF